MHCTDFEAPMIRRKAMIPPHPSRNASALTIGGTIAIALCTALAGCGGSKSPDEQGTGTLPAAGTVSISGSWAVGQTLTAVPSGFTLGTPEGSYHYVWQRCTDSDCTTTTDVGTDSAIHTLAAADVGTYVRAGVYASNTCASGCGSSATAYSAASTIPDLEWAQWSMPDSGTIFCTDGTSPVGCPPSGHDQDGDYLINPPSYTTTPDTVLDNVTGLRWQRVVSVATYTQDGAWNYCARLFLEGYSGWRLPTYIELISIVDYGRVLPAIDTVAFPGTPSTFFWSSSQDAWGISLAVWGVTFDDGRAIRVDHNESRQVRCVR